VRSEEGEDKKHRRVADTPEWTPVIGVYSVSVRSLSSMYIAAGAAYETIRNNLYHTSGVHRTDSSPCVYLDEILGKIHERIQKAWLGGGLCEGKGIREDT